ncbi:lytic murein transglycosylase [Pseudohoeflea coraliihabitans]|uniref:Lytic murein transglycosylase n=1 Tax=Pseudohoeflea coraliihabitans TaxID=2860393 RepID=A0ABS6WP70_9HYPH|nr:lytic murein transglycosylase [Pseudohoeflea sp. DP4N28-3]MBW3097759.1 lytic murein transglycosylase [Pseudohoeflea sp. DP4N28-3]
MIRYLVRIIRACLPALTALCLAAWIPHAASAQSRAAVERQYQQWLERDLWPEARQAGVSRRTFDRALASVDLNWKLPDLAPPGFPAPKKRAQSQAEFRSPGAYFAEKRMRSLASTGAALARRHAATLAAIERKWGVPAGIIVAIWGRESGYGSASIPHSAFEVLATKAFMSTRPELFRKELLAALRIVEKGHVTPAQMKSSWAGAMGQPQFLPSSYLEHAVDFDGDGRADIWNSVPDTLASIANYLARKGWVRGRDWGFEVVIPERMSCAFEGMDRSRTIAQWTEAGIIRISGRPFPAHERQASGMMLVPAGIYGPQFIVTPNFYVIKEYNNSDLYALFIGNLADRISYGSGGFVTSWQNLGAMLRSDIATLQRSLEKAGYDVGGADGLPGYKTRRSIGEWQEKNGKRQTCFPTAQMLR